ncbi:MAG: hypothetical protein ABS76_26470 [Pelagibacterium sp. SCN 64-44]|nr:MAG: hypothetical protein ABS76_26470 [Pelagibacterium sp. SCN 64-44]
MPSDSALRAIVEDDPEETPSSIAEYYGVSVELVRRTMRRLNIRLQSPQRDRKLPDDETLKRLLEEAAETGFAPIMETYGVSAAACSKAKKRLGVSWKRLGRAVVLSSGARVTRGRPMDLSFMRAEISRRPDRRERRRPTPAPVTNRGEQLEPQLF